MLQRLAIALMAAFLLSIGANTTSANAGGTSKAAADNREVVVLLHGLGRSKGAMWLLAHRLDKAGYRVERFGYRSLHNSPGQILDRLGAMIHECCSIQPRKIHFVGHSLGGLIIRAYLARRPAVKLGRVVLLGTPNKGSQLADRYGRKWWFKLLGPTAKILGTHRGSLPDVLPRPDYPVGVIAGIKNGFPNEHVLPGDDDGLVAVESTKLEGMADFVVVETGHSAMRYRAPVALQVVSFLQTGQFAATSR